MKKYLILTAVVICTLSFMISAAASTLSPALDVIAHSFDMTVSAASGEHVSFTPGQFADAAGVGEYDSIRITSLPDQTAGTLLYNDAAACAGQVIPYGKIEKLSFSPCDGVENASFEFTFDGSYTMVCRLMLDGSANSAPTAGPMPLQNTLAGVPCAGKLRGDDADGDALSFEVVNYPESGRLEYSRETGTFVYTPDTVTGSVSFDYRVSDGRGGISKISTVSVNISDSVPSISFADMDSSAYIAAAVTMADMGVMSYSDSGDKLYFEPSEKVTRLEFLVSAMNAFGAKKLPRVSSSGFFDDNDIPDKYKPYVYSASKLGIINGVMEDGKLCFMPDREITVAEAAVILNNVLGYEAKGEYAVDSLPVWASAAVSATYELGISDLNTDDVLTRETAADMLYKLCSLIYE